MTDIAIRTESLSKQYRLGALHHRHNTLRDALIAGLRTPLDRLSSIIHGPLSEPEDGRRMADDSIWALKEVSLEVKRGEAVGLNPQPLSPGPAPDKSIQLKDTTKHKGLSVGHKEKLSVTPSGQSVGQFQLQGTGAAKQKVQTEAVQPFKAKTKRQDFRSPAGSPGLMLR